MPTILAVNGDAAQIAARLLTAAGDQPDRVKVVTGKYVGFSVDDELAEAAGYVLDDDGQADLDTVPLLIDETLPVVPWTPGTEAQAAAEEGEPKQAEQATPAEPAEPVEPPVAPKAEAPKARRAASRSK